MARGKTLLQLTEQLRAECRRSTSASRGIDDLTYLHQVLRRTQEFLYDEYDWPFLRAKREETLSAGQRYYDFPVDMALEGVESVWVKDGDVWLPVERGIGPKEYTAYNSDADVRADPVLRWDVIDTGALQFEVWPIPASAHTLRMDGKRALGDLIANDDTADLDDILIVLFAAAEVLDASDQKDADTKRAAANRRLHQMKVRTRKSRSVNMTGERQSRRGYPRILVARSSGSG